MSNIKYSIVCTILTEANFTNYFKMLARKVRLFPWKLRRWTRGMGPIDAQGQAISRKFIAAALQAKKVEI